MKNRLLFRWGSYGVGTVALCVLLLGLYRLVLGSSDVGLINLGATLLVLALLLRIVRWGESA